MLRLSFVLTLLVGLAPCCRFPAYTVSEGEAVGGAVASGAAGAGTAGGGVAGVGGASGGVAGTNEAGTLSEGAAAGADSGGGGMGGEPSEPDDCPGDPDKLAPGECGCGVPDVSTAQLADCHGIEDALVHRYDFEGSGTEVKDRIGTAHGSIARNATLSKLDGKGVVLLGGGDTGAYVDLPNGLISTLTSATIEAWVTWGGGPANQRIFDFGDTTDPEENKPGTGKSYFFLAPKHSGGSIETTFSSNGTNSPDHVSVEPGPALSQSLSEVVVVADSAANQLRLYVNGNKLGEQAWTAELSAIHDINVWLGRSQWVSDPELNAVFHDFRIYDEALNDAQVASCFAAGPDPSFLVD